MSASHTSARICPALLDFMSVHDFAAERVTSLLADWEDAPEAYTEHTTKLVLHRPPLDLRRPRQQES